MLIHRELARPWTSSFEADAPASAKRPTFIQTENSDLEFGNVLHYRVGLHVHVHTLLSLLFWWTRYHHCDRKHPGFSCFYGKEGKHFNSFHKISAFLQYYYIIFSLTHFHPQVFRVELSSCEAYRTCKSCLEARDPYCGWCMSEGRCLRLDQCQSLSLVGQNGQKPKKEDPTEVPQNIDYCANKYTPSYAISSSAESWLPYTSPLTRWGGNKRTIVCFIFWNLRILLMIAINDHRQLSFLLQLIFLLTWWSVEATTIRNF